VGRAPKTVRSYKESHILEDLGGLVDWVSARVWKSRARPLPDEHLARRVALGADRDTSDGAVRARLRDWQLRWPKLLAFRCATLRCDGIALGGFGPCTLHGKPAVILGKGLALHLLTEAGYVPYHDLLMEPAEGYHVVHLDANPWNNRLANLKVVPD